MQMQMLANLYIVSPHPVRCPLEREKDISPDCFFCVQMDACRNKFVRLFGNLSQTRDVQVVNRRVVFCTNYLLNPTKQPTIPHNNLN